MTRIVQRSRARSDGGFTLIELLVVIVILGILAGVVVFSVSGVGDKGSAAAAKTDYRTLQTAEEAFFAKFQRYATEQELVDNGFLRGSSTLHDVTVQPAGTKPGFTIACEDATSCSTLKVGAGADGNILAKTSRNRANLGMSSPNTEVFETLIDMDSSYGLIPKLATSWQYIDAADRRDVNGNPMSSPYSYLGQPVGTWRFKIRTGVTFHNGAPLDAQAVKDGLFDMLPLSGGASIKAGLLSTQVIDNRCASPDTCVVDFTPTVPNLRVAEQLVHPSFGVVAPGTLAGQNPEGSNTYQAVGTGPFRFVSYSPLQELKTVRNDSYWGSKALLKAMTFKYYASATTRRQALEAGDVDFAFDVPRADIPGVQAKGFTVATSEVGAYQALLLNLNPMPAYDCRVTTKPECHDILADQAVRRAIAKAVDRQALVDAPANFNGLATLDQTLVPPRALAPYGSAVTGFGYDLPGARALLDADGWTVPGGGGTRVCSGGPCAAAGYSGRSLSLTLISGFGTVAANEPLPDYLDAKLTADLGIDIDVVKNDTAFTCQDPVAGTGTPSGAEISYQGRLCTGRADIFIEQGSQNDSNPSFLPLILFFKGAAATVATGSYQYRFNPGATFDNLLAPVLTEPTLAGARQKTAAALDEAVDNQAAAVVLAGIYRFYSMRNTITGFEPFPATVHVKWSRVARIG